MVKLREALRVAESCLTMAPAMRINTDYKLAILTLPSPVSEPDSVLLPLQEVQLAFLEQSSELNGRLMDKNEEEADRFNWQVVLSSPGTREDFRSGS